jgi:hypothetical protein
MSDESKPGQPTAGDRPNLIRSITTPLGFYAFSLLIVEAVITLVLVTANLDTATRFAGLLLSALLFMVVVFLTTHLAIFHPRTLVYASKDWLAMEKLTATENVSRTLKKALAMPPAVAAPSSGQESARTRAVGAAPGPEAFVERYLELERRAFAGLEESLRGGWRLDRQVKLVLGGRTALTLDALIQSRRGGAVVVETKRLQARNLVATLEQLDRLTLLYSQYTGARASQLLLILPDATEVSAVLSDLEASAGLYSDSSTAVAVYDEGDGLLAFPAGVPPYIRPDRVANG